MVLDINFFRTDKAECKLSIIKESQRKRYSDPQIVENVIKSDSQWRNTSYRIDNLNRVVNFCNKAYGEKKKNKTYGANGTNKSELDLDLDLNLDLNGLDFEKVDPDYLKKCNLDQVKSIKLAIDDELKKLHADLDEFSKQRFNYLTMVGNIVHESVPVSDNEDDNKIVRMVGEVNCKKKYSHRDLVEMIEGADLVRGQKVQGHRGYFLRGPLVFLEYALFQYGLDLMYQKGFTPLYTPFFMNKQIMSEVAQLSQFDDELYKVIGRKQDGGVTLNGDDEKYLIATSEQPIVAYHRDEWLEPIELPYKYCGVSTCFRQEAGSAGRDLGGIFRVHQFEKIEQFVICSPHGNESWELMEQMLGNAEEFYQGLGIGYRVVNIVSGALNNAAAKKYDLEGWFPGSNAFRELVSCSNCLDYQSRRALVRYDRKKDGKTEFVHMLNSTLCAMTRVICVILETYQTADGIEIPKVLHKYFPTGYPKVIPFKKIPQN